MKHQLEIYYIIKSCNIHFQACSPAKQSRTRLKKVTELQLRRAGCLGRRRRAAADCRSGARCARLGGMEPRPGRGPGWEREARDAVPGLARDAVPAFGARAS